MGAPRIMPMTAYMAEVNRWSALPFVWGQTDCIMVLADWAGRWLGVDPAADIRLTYGTAGECQRVTRFWTHPMDAIGPRIVAAGGVPSEPAPGCVGVLWQDEVNRPHGGLALRDGWWAAKAEQGVFVTRPRKVLSCWDVGYAE
jgi:hypothetical protein